MGGGPDCALRRLSNVSAAYLLGGQYDRAAHTLDGPIFVAVADKFNGEGLP